MPLIQNIFTNNNPLSLSNGSAGSDFIITTDDGAKIKSNNIITYSINNTFTDDKELVSKKYVDDAVASGGGGSGSGFPLTQNESAGGFLIIDLGTATNPNDAVSKAVLDAGLSGKVNTSTLSNYYTSTQTDTLLNAKAPINNPTFSGTVSGIDKSMVGLGNVDNTSDLNKPISTATQTALNLKADTTALSSYVLKAGDTMSGNLTVPNATSSGHAVNKSQLDLKADTTALNNYVLKSGDSMTGTLTNTTSGNNNGITINSTSGSGHCLEVNKSSGSGDAIRATAGNINMNSSGKIINLPNGTNTNDAVNKSQMDTADNLRALKSGDTFSGAVNFNSSLNANTTSNFGGQINQTNGIINQTSTTGTNVISRPLSLGSNCNISQSGAPANSLSETTITILNSNNTTQLGTGGGSQFSVGGTVAGSTQGEGSAQRIIRFNPTQTDAGTNTLYIRYNAYSTREGRLVLANHSNTSSDSSSKFAICSTANSSDNFTFKLLSNSVTASDQTLMTFYRGNVQFNADPPLCGISPSTSSHLTNKSYVDGLNTTNIKTNTTNQVISTPTTNANALQITHNGTGGSAFIAYTTSSSNTGTCMRILNNGSGDCLRVEDTNGDTTFVKVDPTGRMGVNTSTTGTLTNTFEVNSLSNSTNFLIGDSISLNTHSDIYLGASGITNRPYERITYRANATSDFQTLYFQLYNITAGGNAKWSYCKAGTNDATMNICPEIRRVIIGEIDSGNTPSGTLDINSPATIDSLKFAGTAKTGSNVAININSMGKISNCLDPTNAQDVATKNYVDTRSFMMPFSRWSLQSGNSMNWSGSGLPMYISGDGTTTLIEDTNGSPLTADDMRANNNLLGSYIEYSSQTNAFQQYNCHVWKVKTGKAGYYELQLNLRLSDGASNHYHQFIYRTAGGTNVRANAEIWHSTDESERRFAQDNRIVYLEAGSYFSWEMGNVSGAVVRPYTTPSNAWIEVFIKYLGA
jgi:hypothetical protein